MTKALTTVGPLQEALALATDAGDLATMHDVAAMATALQKGARARGIGIGAENQAAEVVLRAERAIGITLADMLAKGQRRASGKQTGRGQGKEVADLPPTLDEVLANAGIAATPPTLMNWRRLAQLPEDQFEALIEAKRAENARLAKVDFYRAAAPAPTQEQKQAALERAAEADEADTSVFVAFEAASGDLIDGISQLPSDELARVAVIIKNLATAYNAEKEDRS